MTVTQTPRPLPPHVRRPRGERRNLAIRYMKVDWRALPRQRTTNGAIIVVDPRVFTRVD